MRFVDELAIALASGYSHPLNVDDLAWLTAPHGGGVKTWPTEDETA